MLCLLSCLIQCAFSYIILIFDLLDQATCMSAVTKPTITCSVSRVVHTRIPAYTNITYYYVCIIFLPDQLFPFSLLFVTQNKTWTVQLTTNSISCFS